MILHSPPARRAILLRAGLRTALQRDAVYAIAVQAHHPYHSIPRAASRSAATPYRAEQHIPLRAFT